MALLGLFSKRDKNKTSGSSTTGKSSGASVADTSSVAETTEYVLPERDLPTLPNQVYANGLAEASSSKFHLGFRKRSTPGSDVADNNFLRPPQFPLSPSTRSEADLDVLRPPPSRSDLLSTYADPKSALSTRSLPDAQASAQHNAIAAAPASTDSHSPAAPKKQGGLFSWAHRERKKSKVSDAPPSLSVDVSTESFNLKAFRHVRPESPSPEASIASTALAPPVIPRPRGNSVASVDSSQRISVAAFREMAARRSAAPSPTSSPILLRPPSRTDSLEHSHLRPSGSSFQRSPVVNRGSTLALHQDSSSSESEESGDSESDESAGSSTMRPKRQRTITQKSAGKASTELGHITRTPITMPASRSALGHGEDASDSSRSQQGQAGGFFRSRASQSASALHPNAAARRASQLVAEQAVSAPPPRSKPVPAVPAAPSDRARSKSRARYSSSDSSSNSDSDDSDDAPLASFVRPPRPGSAASNATSGSRSRMPTKPLIDISQLGGTPPPMPSLPRSEQASPSQAVLDKRASPPLSKRTSPPVPEKDTPSSTETKSTRPTHSEKPSLSDRLARVAQGAGGKSVEALATVPPFERRSLDVRPALSDSTERGRVNQPARSQTAPMGMLDKAPSPTPSPAPRPRANTGQQPPSPNSATNMRQQPPSPNAAAVYDLTDSTPIVPTLIRERSPPPAFAVTSRPASQLSLNTTGRLSDSHATIRVVNSGSGSASSSPTARTSFGGSISSSGTPATTVSSDSPIFSNTTPFASTALTKPSSPAVPSSSRPSPSSRQRSSTLIPNSGAHPSSGFTGGGLLASSAANPSDSKSSSNASRAPQQPSAARGGRTRSSTLLPQMDISPSQRTPVDTESAYSSRMASSSSSSSQSQQGSSHRLPQRSRMPFSASSPSSVVPPSKPFANSERGASPASSTGDSSSGRTPLTPADGSDLGLGDSRSTISGVSALGGAKRMHRRNASVTFEEETEKDRGRQGPKSAAHDEERRKERRRSEAKAAIELGKVVNGKITIEDDHDEDMPLNSLGPRMSVANPMLNFTPASPMTWAPSPTMMGPSPFMMPPPNADPQFLAAHQHAMMVAKQAYQMAVAQQAMAAANDEWERGSSVSAFGGMGMAPMGGMPGMMPGYGMGWNNPMMFSSAQTMYAGSTAGSELGAAWGSRSEYGGPARNSRASAAFAPSRASAYGLGAGQRSESQPAISAAPGTRPSPRPRTKTSPADSNQRTRQPPPSSWRQ